MVTMTLPVVALVGTGAVIDPELQLVETVVVLLKVTVLVPWFAPNPVPVIVIDVPTEPEVGDRAVMLGTTVNAAALLATPPTVTTTLPLPPVAPAGTGTVIVVVLQLVGVAVVPPKVTVLLPCVAPKPVPAIVIAVPAMPEVADRLLTVGFTLNLTPLLGPPFTVTTTLPVVAAAGTVAAIAVAFQLVGVAATPLNVTVLLP
jgi:hypothetical protein